MNENDTQVIMTDFFREAEAPACHCGAPMKMSDIGVYHCPKATVPHQPWNGRPGFIRPGSQPWMCHSAGWPYDDPTIPYDC